MRTWWWLASLAGCAPRAADAPPPWVAEEEPPPVTDTGDPHFGVPVEVRVMRAPSVPPSARQGARWETQTIVSHEVAPARPARVGRRDIRLRNARLDNALRHLAQEGRFNLVVEGDLAVPVTVHLERVEPYDALLAIAEAHGVEVRYRDNIVIVAAP